MDEAGHSGDSGATGSGSGGESRDRALTNSWAGSSSPWSNAGAALDPEEEDATPWRRPAEVRPFARRSYGPDRGSGDAEVRPFAEPRNTDEVLRGYADPVYPTYGSFGAEHPTAGAPDPAEPEPPGDHLTEDLPRPSRFSGLLSRLPTGGRGNSTADRPVGPPPGFRAADAPTSGYGPPDGYGPSDGYGKSDGYGPADEYRPSDGYGQPDGYASAEPARGTAPDPLSPAAPSAMDSLDPSTGVDRPTGTDRPTGVDRRLSDLRPAVDAPPPSSAPPYPYEGDLDDEHRGPSRPVGQQRTAVPLSRPFRPSTPTGRRADWNAPESARHALQSNTPDDGMPRIGSPAAPPETPPAAPETAQPRPSYDPATFPRRLPYEPPAGQPAPAGPPAEAATGYAQPPPYADDLTGHRPGEPGAGTDEDTARSLPQRVPAEPDVPTVPEPPAVEPTAETPALARIASHLRRDDVLPTEERQEGFDVTAILAAVREVDGVRDAQLRTTPQGAHSLRLDLAEGADPAEVSRQVARLLSDRMGLDAAMKGATGMPAPATPERPSGAVPGSDPRSVSPAGLGDLGDPRPGPVTGNGVPPTASGTASVPAAPRVPTQPIPAGRAPVSGGPSGVATQPLPHRTPNPHASLQEPFTPRSAAAPESVSAPPVAGPAYLPGPSTTAETVPHTGDHAAPRPLDVGQMPVPRAVIENVRVTTFGIKATVEVHLAVGDRTAVGTASGPSLDGYLLRLCAVATADAIDQMLATTQHADGPPRCDIHHAAVVPFGSVQVAVVVVLLSCGTWVDQLAGSAVVTGDDGRAMVQATMAAINRRLEALLS